MSKNWPGEIEEKLILTDDPHHKIPYSGSDGIKEKFYAKTKNRKKVPKRVLILAATLLIASISAFAGRNLWHVTNPGTYEGDYLKVEETKHISFDESINDPTVNESVASAANPDESQASDETQVFDDRYFLAQTARTVQILSCGKNDLNGRDMTIRYQTNEIYERAEAEVSFQLEEKPVNVRFDRESGYLIGISYWPGEAIEDKEQMSESDVVFTAMDWYEKLHADGIDFVKVDGQSSFWSFAENSLPIGPAAKGMHQALEGGASYMDGAIINCMGMAMENILSRPTSAISRNSDDFVPNKENGFVEHLLQNAYNSVYHDELYYCDWDMFWTKHEDAVKHSLLRAISGGPIYVSDQIGDTNPDVLKPLAYHNGEILMMDHSAKPTEDCMFSDPMKTGVLKLHNTASWGSVKKGGGIAVYNLTDGIQDFSFRPADIPQLEESDNYWVYDYFAKNAFSLGKQESYESRLDLGGFGWFVLLPKGKYGTCLGLLDKFVGFTAVESIFENDSTQTVVVKESGTLGWLSEKEPQKVMVNSVDVTSSVKKNDFLYEITLPEGPHKTVLSFVW